MKKYVNYDILYNKEEYALVVMKLVELINKKYYNDPRLPGRPLKISVMNIVKAFIYVLKSGCQWYMIPK